MLDLDTAVRTWRHELALLQELTRDDLDELEDHFRATVGELVETGIAPDQAVALARHALGKPTEIATEYRKNDDPWWRRFVRAGWAMFAVSFMLPVHQAGITIFDTTLGDGVLPGVQAFLLALQGDAGTIGVISALTNVVVLMTLWRITSRDRRGVTVLAVLSVGATLLNGWWLMQFDTVSELMIGYYMWWAAFGTVASGLVVRARALTRRAAPAIAAS
jgi:hypothetical protein